MNVINELVNEIEEVAEDKSAYDALVAEGLDPFKTDKVSDICKASEISSIVLKELINRVDGFDSSFANLVFLQTEEGLKDLQKKIDTKRSFDNGEGGFFRSDLMTDDLEEHEITPEEAAAIDEYLDEYKRKLDEEFSLLKKNKQWAYKNMKARKALKGLAKGSFRRV